MDDERKSIGFALIGASNLTYALPQAVDSVLRRFAGETVRFYLAHGPGRSFGIDAGVLGLKFRGHRESALLERIDRDSDQVHLAGAIITDVGNDIPYEIPVPTILAWVEELTRALAAPGATVGITALPVGSIQRVTAWKYRLIRPVFYPGCKLSLDETFARVLEVQSGLEAITGRVPGDVRLLPVESSWYGFDRFHLRRSARRTAWRAWVDAVTPSHLPASSARGARVPTLAQCLRLRFISPEEYFVFGRRRGKRRAEPVRLGDRVSLHVC